MDRRVDRGSEREKSPRQLLELRRLDSGVQVTSLTIIIAGHNGACPCPCAKTPSH
jgi:hypothetical protein